MFREDRGVKKLSDKEKGALIGYIHAGFSDNRIHLDTWYSRSTVKLWRMRFQETGDVNRKVGSGRGNGSRRKTTEEEDMKIRDAVAAKPVTTAQEIAGIHFNIVTHFQLI